MKEPKKIYLVENAAWTCYEKEFKHSVEFISVKQLKIYIEEKKGKNIKGKFLIKVDELLKYLNEP